MVQPSVFVDASGKQSPSGGMETFPPPQRFDFADNHHPMSVRYVAAINGRKSVKRTTQGDRDLLPNPKHTAGAASQFIGKIQIANGEKKREKNLKKKKNAPKKVPPL